MQRNLADIFEVVVDAVPDREALVARGMGGVPPTTAAGAAKERGEEQVLDWRFIALMA